jgi:hypothetical protein
MSRRDSKQTRLFDLVSTRQTRRQSREMDDLYAAIRALRRSGVSVYAEGKNHRVGGTIMATHELMWFARVRTRGRS